MSIIVAKRCQEQIMIISMMQVPQVIEVIIF